MTTALDHTARTFGAALRRWAASKEGYRVLDRLSGGASWVAGGCSPLAHALGLLLAPHGVMMALVDIHERTQHVVVALGPDLVLDAEGVSSQTTLKQRWHRREGVVRGRLVLAPPPGETPDELGCSVAVVQALADELRHVLGKDLTDLRWTLARST